MGLVNELGYDITVRADRLTRMEVLKAYLDMFAEAEQKGTFPDTMYQTWKEYLEEYNKLERVERCSDNILEFAYEYFSDEKNPGNMNNLIPEGSKIQNSAKFHVDLCNLLNVVSSTEVNKRVGYAAPRGHAKSAYLSNIFPLHQVVYDLRRYILIISETDSASKKFLEWIALQLKHNVKLRNDFGELLSPNKQGNDKDNQESFVTRTGILVESSSIGKQLRGKRNGAYRPDLLILDDLESSKNTNTHELREKNLDWFNKVVIPIGDPDNTAFVYMGTIVHAKGLLPHVLERADFDSRKFSAIVSEPEREDLWEKFEEMLRNVEDEDRLQNALAFYDDNKAEMDKGASVLWPQRWDYASLVIEKVSMGSRAFNSEFMNNPIDPESQLFNPESFLFADYADLVAVKPYLEYFGAWDIAMGKNNRSDYNAIIVIGRDKRTGVLYVVDAWAKKVPAHKALEVALDKIKEYGPKIFAVETVASQHDLYRQLRDLLIKERIYNVKLKPVINRSRKEERIESMEPLFENGAIRFMRHQRLLLEQLEQFPNGDNDDLPDCLQMVVDVSAKAKRRTWYRKPEGL